MTPMILLAVFVGLALLFFGRKLFWLFVAGAGFAGGIVLAREFLRDQQDWVILLIAVIAGLAGALIAVFVQRLAIGIGGFIAGGYILFSVAGQFNESLAWVGFLIGGIIGAFLVFVLFNWALIVLSSLTGAVLITDTIRLEPILTLVMFGILLLAGLAVQASQLNKRIVTKAKTA